MLRVLFVGGVISTATNVQGNQKVTPSFATCSANSLRGKTAGAVGFAFGSLPKETGGRNFASKTVPSERLPSFGVAHLCESHKAQLRRS
jgi:hypothetical protein